jgi:hypothetical protein
VVQDQLAPTLVERGVERLVLRAGAAAGAVDGRGAEHEAQGRASVLVRVELERLRVVPGGAFR